MSIPGEITGEHVLRALQKLDVIGEVNWRQSTKYDLYYEGEHYPPKEVIRYASEIATREMFEWFGGGRETNDFLIRRGFRIVHKGTTIPVPLRYGQHAGNKTASTWLEGMSPGSGNPFEDDDTFPDPSTDREAELPATNPVDIDLQYIQEESVTETERETIVKTRVGQSSFKAALLQQECKCKLCGIEDPRFLIASHIKPWRDAEDHEKLDVNNGMLLCPNHDQAFDKGYISFQDDGNILISDSVDEQTLLFLNIRRSFQIHLTPQQLQYMEWHRTYIFKP